MIAYVFKRKRKKKGKIVPDRNYSGRYRLEGDFSATTVALQTADKQVAEAKLKKIVAEKERELVGLVAPKIQRESADRPLAEHLNEFITDLETKQRAEKYIHDLKSRFTKVASDCHWKYPRDIQADRFMQWRSQYKAAPKTLNEYLNACNALINWMIKLGRMTHNPLLAVEKINLKGKQQLRRAMTDDEFNRLLEHSEDYRLLYLAAVYTGLRQSELLNLLVVDVHLTKENPYLIAQASTTKNGLKATIPLHPNLVDEFRSAVEGKDPADLVFPQYAQPDRRFRRHLRQAGIPQIDATGRKLDFHALRYTFCTKLAKQGVPMRLAQELMRHSDPRLTANIYTDTAQLPTFGAVQGLDWH